MLPVPDISHGYIDTKTGQASKTFYNWLKSLESGGAAGNWAIFVGQLSPPVLPNGQDQTANLQAAIDHYTSTGATLQFGAGTYIFNSAIVLKPNIILRGVGIDITILKVGVDDIELITRWGDLADSEGVAGIENLTVWGYGDRNATQGSQKLVNIGPFDLYWMRCVKAIHARNMSLTAIGAGIGITESCVINKTFRDGINLTGTNHVQIINNDIDECGDDCIAFHTSSSATGINEYSARITGNKAQKSFGIKLLGVRNASVSNNVLRFYYGYGIFCGIDDTFGEGKIAKFNISINNNSFLDGMNADIVSASVIRAAIFFTGGNNLVNPGGPVPGPPLYISTPDPWINLAGNNPRGQDGNISIVSNNIRQTINNITKFSDSGFGELWNNEGPLDPPMTTFIGEMAGISFHTDLENCTVASNTMHGVFNGVDGNGGELNNVTISGNTIFRVSNHGVFFNAPGPSKGTVSIDNNLIDCDPYMESSIRTQPLDGSWTAGDGSTQMGIWIQNYVGFSIKGNRFRNCIRPIKGSGANVNFITEGNILEFDWSGAANKGISNIGSSSPSADIYWFCFSDPNIGNYNFRDASFLLSNNAQPSNGYFYQGHFVKNDTPALDGNNMVILGWLRLTSGNAHVAGTDWAVARVSHVSPAV